MSIIYCFRVQTRCEYYVLTLVCFVRDVFSLTAEEQIIYLTLRKKNFVCGNINSLKNYSAYLFSDCALRAVDTSYYSQACAEQQE